MGTGIESIRGITRASKLKRHTDPEQRGSFSFSTLSGRLTEFVITPPSGVYTALATLIYEAQCNGEPCVWIAGFPDPAPIFYPPDFAANGIDVSALAVIRTSDSRMLFRAIEHLLKSNGFGLIIMDLSEKIEIPQGKVGTFARLASRNGSAVCFVTRGKRRTLGSLISVRFEVKRGVFSSSKGIDTSEYLHIRALKDKNTYPHWKWEVPCYGADHLR